jgi:type IV pilus assembly protein PilE
MRGAQIIGKLISGRSRGFTLIELMIVVAIIAIIAAVAIPSYRDSVWKGKRGEAKAALLKGLQAEERAYTANNAYTCYPSGTAPCTNAPSGAFPQFSGDNLANSRYTVAAVAGPVVSGGVTLCPTPNNAMTQCVVVVATVIGGPDPTCGTTLSMDTIGNKAPALTGATAACWR